MRPPGSLARPKARSLLKQSLDTVTCPGCGKLLPAWAQTCQFCGAVTGVAAQPNSAVVQARRRYRLSWKEVAYTVLAWIWVLSGAYGMLQATGVVPDAIVAFGGAGYVGIIAGIQLLIGLGLLAQNDWVMFIAKIVCYVQALFASFAFIFVLAFGGPFLRTALGLLYVLFELGLALFQVYILNEFGD